MENCHFRDLLGSVRICIKWVRQNKADRTCKRDQICTNIVTFDWSGVNKSSNSDTRIIDPLWHDFLWISNHFRLPKWHQGSSFSSPKAQYGSPKIPLWLPKAPNISFLIFLYPSRPPLGSRNAPWTNIIWTNIRWKQNAQKQQMLPSFPKSADPLWVEACRSLHFPSSYLKILTLPLPYPSPVDR